jgi:predicted permease
MKRWLDILRLRVRSLVRRDSADRDLARELRFHLDERAAELVSEGMEPAAARRTATREFGALPSIEQQCRETRRVGAVANFAQDLRYALRILGREPMLTVAATVSIALGVGVNLSIFGLGNTLLFSRPTAHRADELVNIRTTGGSHTSHPVWRTFHESGALAGIAGYFVEAEINWRGTEQSAAVTALIVTANYFEVLNPPIAMGRGFSADEAQAERHPKLAVIGHRFWLSRLGGDPSIVGRTIVLNGEPFDVRGILPAGTRSAAPFGIVPDVYIPITRATAPSLDRTDAGHLQLIGRLRDGQTVDEGHAALAVVAARVASDLNDERGASVRVFEPAGGLTQAKEFREIVFFFLALFVITVHVLTIACANVAGLLLARSTARGREIAVRLALGATRGRLVQQLLTEGFVLAVLGVSFGLLLTAGVGAVASQISLPLPFPIAFDVDFTGRVFWLAAALVVLSAVLCGLTPAIHATRPALSPALKQGTPSYGYRRFTLRGLIVAGQVAISVVLLVVTLLFARNLALAHTLAPGFDVDNTMVVAVTFVEGRQGERATPAVAAMVERVRALPGIRSAAYAEGVPLTISGYNWTGTRIRIEGHDQPVRVDYSSNYVSPGYFDAMGIRLLRGRDFTAADRFGGPMVIVVNEEFARRYVPDAHAIGRHLYLPTGRDTEALAEIVGVVANSKYRTIGEEVEPAIYESYVQRRGAERRVRIIAAGTVAGAIDAGALRAAILEVDGTAAVEVLSMSSALAVAFVPSRVGAVVMGALGVLGALLATVGLYGVIAFNVGRRTSEVAVRIALGASRSAVLRLVLVDTAWLAGFGIAAGLVLALVATPLLSSFLVAELSANDPISFAATAALVTLTSLIAAWRPARRAMRVEPAIALRSE